LKRKYSKHCKNCHKSSYWHRFAAQRPRSFPAPGMETKDYSTAIRVYFTSNPDSFLSKCPAADRKQRARVRLLAVRSLRKIKQAHLVWAASSARSDSKSFG